jgi:drug/metabolite transporter (DMT)-like permease
VTEPRGRLLLAYATVYLVWGSSYLAMKVAVETMPPLPMAGVRYLLAGLVLVAVSYLRSSTRATAAEWRAAAVVGLALMGSNAAVAFAVTRIPSGVAALLVAVTPAWMLGLEWWYDRSHRPARGVIPGIGLGLAGIVLLVGPMELLGGDRIDPVAAAAVMFGTLLWAWGSLRGRHGPRPASAQLVSGMQMVGGGAGLLLLTLVSGGFASVDVATFTARSWLGFWFLVLFASLAGFTAYVYLLQHATPARASTYAFVNPVVAVVIGAAVAGEPLTPRVLLAAAVIVGGVALIVLGPGRTPSVQGGAEGPAS